MRAREAVVEKALNALPLERRQMAVRAANGMFDDLTSTYWDSNTEAVARVWAAAIDATGNVEPPARAPAPKERKREKEPKPPQGREVSFPEIDPWADPVNGADLLNEIRETFERHLALVPSAAVALTLWVVHAHAHDLCEVSPLLVLKSPAMRCGKTTCLLLLGRLVPRPLPASNITASAVFRAVEKYRPTLLIDEADSFIGDNEELRGLLNSGHVRGNATVIRTVGQDFEPRAFSTWAPKAIASIGALTATLEDRAVTIPMRRRAKGERIERLRLDRLGTLEGLPRKILRWIEDHAKELRDADPETPECLDDRGADNWRVLLAVADVAAGTWPILARTAAVVLSTGRVDETGAREQLLADIAGIWNGTEADRLPSADLVVALVALEDRPWAEWSGGRPLTTTGLARLLKGFDIRSGNIRTMGGVPKGYLREQFQDAIRRYVPEGLVAAPACPVADEYLATATGKPAPGLECSVVADETRKRGGDR